MTHPKFEPDEEWRPDPQTDGRLGPPGKKPPTAVGTETPPPPHQPDPYARSGSELSLTQQITRGALAALLVATGAAAVELLTPVAGISAGIGFSVLGAAMAVRALRGGREVR